MIDIGANLTNQSFRNDVGAVLARASQAGVTHVVVTGTSVDSSRDARTLVQAHPSTLTSTAGVHPHDAKTFDDATLDALRELAASPGVVAIGECGLDFNRNYSPPAAQRLCFEQQVLLAGELGMPLFLHERDAHAAFLDILARHRDKFPRAVVHCFTGTRHELLAYLDLDLHIGITGWVCDERRGQALAEIIQEIPPTRLMIETDSPYLIPRTMRPKPRHRRNEPAFLTWIRDRIAQTCGRSPDEIDAATTETSRRFFARDA